MGALGSRHSHGVQEEETAPASAYRYPPKSGLQFFGSHFIMGGERFETSHPECFLFGENADLNFLDMKPVQFPYPQHPGGTTTEPIRTLQSLVHIRRDSVKFVKIPSSPEELSENSVPDKPEEPENLSESVNESAAAVAAPQLPCRYNIEFTFDCDSPCTIQIFYFAGEEQGPNGIYYVSKSPELSSSIYQYEIGSNQLFSHSEHVIEPTRFSDEEWKFNASSTTDSNIYSVVIQCIAEPDGGGSAQSHSTVAVVERSAEGQGYLLKPLKQKLFCDGVCYLLQELYGIENKQAAVSIAGSTSESTSSTERTSDKDDSQQSPANFPASDDCNAECVICMSELRDTLILPCRHLCLCCTCAETLRYKASNCPICRSPFRALLQMKSYRKIKTSMVNTVTAGGEINQELSNLLTRYEAYPLIEALNGPVELQRIGSLSLRTLHGPVLKQRPQQQNQPVQEAGQKKKKKKKVQRQLAPIQQVLTPPVPLTSMADGYANSAMLVQQSHPLSPEATDLEDLPGPSSKNSQMSDSSASDEDDENSATAIARIIIEEECEYEHQSRVPQSRSMGEIVRKHSASDGEEMMINGHEKINEETNGPQRSKSQDAVAGMLNKSITMSTTSSWSSVSSSKPLILKRDQSNNDHPLV